MSNGNTEGQSKVTIPSYGAGKIQINGLTQDEVEKLMAGLLSGAYYAKGEGGRITFFPAYEKLPDPIADENMLPFWRPHQKDGGYQAEMFSEFVHSKEVGYSPSITIQHLCGYNYTPGYYKEMAERLKSYGFEILRSPRGEDWKYWELWFLPGLWRAKGALGELVKLHEENHEQQLKAALEFLRINASFGTLDVSTQRLVMTID